MTLNLGFASLLTLIFVVAKLFGMVTWSWWLVFAPILIGLSVSLFLLLCLLVAAVCVAIAADRVK